MIPPKDRKPTLTEHHKDPELIAVDDVDQMKQIFEKARRVVRPIVKRESAAEVVSVDLLNIRLKDAYPT